MYKVALQLYGISRYFDFQVKYWYALKKILEENDIELDIHITTWNDEYSKKWINHEIFTDFHLIEYPKKGFLGRRYVENYKENIKKQVDKGKSGCLYLAQYCMYKSYSNRKKWQYNCGKEYDYIIVTRPDYYFSIKYIVDFLKFYLNYNDPYKIHINPQGSFAQKTQFPSRFSDDNNIIGNQQAIDLFCTAFNYLYKQNHNYMLSHHLNYSMTCMMFNQIPEKKASGMIIRSITPHLSQRKQPLMKKKEWNQINTIWDSRDCNPTPAKNI